MAVQEHGCYESFGYHVTSFFAPACRFGPPKELKLLIDAAHGAGLLVLMDVVHSHASANSAEGLSRFDGAQAGYFHEGERGHHKVWGSRLFDYGRDEVMRFLLCNLLWYAGEFRFDGFRFDAVTTMLYTHRGLEPLHACANMGPVSPGRARVDSRPALHPPAAAAAAAAAAATAAAAAAVAATAAAAAAAAGGAAAAAAAAAATAPAVTAAAAAVAAAAAAPQRQQQPPAALTREVSVGSSRSSGSSDVDTDAQVYLMLANFMLHENFADFGLPRPVLTIAEECSGHSALCLSPLNGGLVSLV